MPAAPNPEQPAAFDPTPFLKGAAEMPRLNIQMVMRANEIVSEAARAIWESEVELVRLETEEGAKWLSLARPTMDPGKVPVVTFTQWHESAERIFMQMRGMGDVMRKCGWELFELYAESMSRPGRHYIDA